MQTLGKFLQKKFIGTDELRRNLTEILEKLPQEGGELVITQHGKPQAVLLSLEVYKRLMEQIQKAVTDTKAGRGTPASEV